MKMLGAKEQHTAILGLSLADNDKNTIIRRFRPTLVALWGAVRDKRREWVTEVIKHAPKDAGEEYYLPYFHRFALQGVADILQVVSDHWNGQIGWGSWAEPTQPITLHGESSELRA